MAPRKLRSLLALSALGLTAVRVPPLGSKEAVSDAVRPRSAPAVPSPTRALPVPAALRPFQSTTVSGAGTWHPAGRLLDDHSAVYETAIALPDDPAVVAGFAWMDTNLLRARLYSGSLSPGRLFWKYSAPVTPAASKTLVAAFNGGFKLDDSGGGYLSEGHLMAPLRAGAASIVIYRNGRAKVGEWSRDVCMTPDVIAVRQNLTLLVEHGEPVAGLNPEDTSAWGSSLDNVVDTWRTGLGVTADGALVYVAGPMNIVALAEILVRAGAIRAMVLDMEPYWPVFATYAPATPNGIATPSNSTNLLPTMYQTPGRIF